MLAKEIQVKDITTINWVWEQEEFSFLNTPRSCYGLLSVVKGKIDYILPDKVISLKQGSFIYLPKDSVYKARFRINEGKVESILVNFDISEEGNVAIPDFYNSHDKTLQFETAVKRLLALEDEENSDYLKKAYFFYCLHFVFSDYMSNHNQADTELIREAKILLKSTEKSIEQIAADLKISASGLRKKFKDATGFSPADWRCQRRIETAKQLLLTSDLSIDAIAEKTGFYDTPYFYKKFYALVGTTPKKYRKTDIMF